MANKRLDILSESFQPPGDANPAPSLAEAVAKLLTRYKPDAKQLSSKSLKHQHISMPDIVIKGLIESPSLKTELFASPLNFNPGMHAYFTPHKEDELFGAHHDAYSAFWSGSCFCLPILDDEDMAKALRWAIHSTEAQETPTLVAFLLPLWPNTAYRAHLAHYSIKHDATIKKQDFAYQTSAHWQRFNSATQLAKWDVDLLISANESGLAELYDEKIDPRALHTGLRGLLKTTYTHLLRAPTQTLQIVVGNIANRAP